MKQFIILVLAFLIVLPVSAEPPNILHYQGRLISVDDDFPVPEEVPMTFRLYSAEDSGEPLWEEAHVGDNLVTITNGKFSVELGSIELIEPAVFDGPTLFLGIIIDEEELLPRQPVGGSAYALLASKSLDAERLGGMEVSDFVTEEELDEEDRFLTEDSVGRACISNDYNDLDNTPELSGYVTGDDLPNFDEFLTATDVGLAALSNNYNDLDNLPDLSVFVPRDEISDFLTETDVAPVALSNDYNDLDNLPTNSGLGDLNTDVISSVVTRSYSAENTPITDPQDGNPVTSTIEFPDSGPIRSVKVTLNISHEDVSELTVTLTSPAGTTITLHQEEEEGLTITFPDNRQPSEGSLDDFIEEEASGTWTLTLSDQTIGNVATVSSWSLEISLLSDEILTINGEIDVTQNRISNLGVPLADSDAVSKRDVKAMLQLSERYYLQVNQGVRSRNLGVHSFCFLISFGLNDRGAFYGPVLCELEENNSSWTLAVVSSYENTTCRARCIDF